MVYFISSGILYDSSLCSVQRSDFFSLFFSSCPPVPASSSCCFIYFVVCASSFISFLFKRSFPSFSWDDQNRIAYGGTISHCTQVKAHREKNQWWDIYTKNVPNVIIVGSFCVMNFCESSEDRKEEQKRNEYFQLKSAAMENQQSFYSQWVDVLLSLAFSDTP